MPDLPSGTVTFLFTDIEGSTRRWEGDSPVMSRILARHDAIMRDAIASHNGYVFKTVGDAFYASFRTAPDALNAALVAQYALFAEDWGPGDPLRVRMALYTGLAELRDGDYYGQPLNRIARLLSAGYGGQTLVPSVTGELIRDALPPGVSLRDLGEARLKDLLRPVHVFQIVAPDLPPDFPPLKTLDPRRTNLPAQPTMFVGRERETREVASLLHQDGVRLVTLTGTGGTGKTRLGLQVAADCAELFPDGVSFVPLADVVDSARVILQIAETLGVTEGGGQSLTARLYDAVGAQTLLLVLDNFEQVTDASPAISQLLAAAPGVKALVTSRSPLRIYGEREYPVPPLPLPDQRLLPPVEQLMQYESVRLFVARAQEVKADFTLTAANAKAVVDICDKLDGLPLPIELAAARIKLFPPRTILQQLTTHGLQVLTGGARDLPARQQTMRGAIDWSYTTLGASEQMLFARMAVFAGGGTLTAIEAICNPAHDLAIDIIDGLSSLSDKSLLRQPEDRDGEPRFAMLGTIREYALERLEARGEAETMRSLHAMYYAALAEEAEPHLIEAMQGAWLARLEEEHDNVRVAVRDMVDAGEYETAARIVGAFWRYWSIRGFLTEGRRWMERVLSHAEEVPAPQRARVFAGLGLLMSAQGDEAGARARFEESLAIGRALGHQEIVAHALSSLARIANDYGTARHYYEESLAIRRALGNTAAVARTLNSLGITAQGQGDDSLARASYEESITIARANGHKQLLALALSLYGALAQRQRDYLSARSRYEESLTISRETGDTGTIAVALNALGTLASQQGDYIAARAFGEQSLALRRELGDMSRIAAALTNLGVIAQRQEDYAAAQAYFEECLALRRELGDPRVLPIALNNFAFAARHQGKHDVARAAYQESLAISQQRADTRGIIEALEGMAALVGTRGDGVRAARLWSAVESLREQSRFARVDEDQNRYERERDAVRARTDARVWADAWSQGRAMDATQAIEVAGMDSGPDLEAETERPPPPGVPDLAPREKY